MNLLHHPDDTVRRLYRTILDAPEDDGLRLAFCDEFERSAEFGTESEQAYPAFVRGQIELAGHPLDLPWIRSNPPLTWKDTQKGSHLKHLRSIYDHLLTLFRQHGQQWYGDLVGGEIGERCEGCDGSGQYWPPGRDAGGPRGPYDPCGDCVKGRIIADCTLRVPCGPNEQCERCGSNQRQFGATGERLFCFECRRNPPHTLLTIARGFPDAVAIPTMRGLMGERCERCGGGGELAVNMRTPPRKCPDCSGVGENPGLAPVLAGLPLTGVTVGDKRPLPYDHMARPEVAADWVWWYSQIASENHGTTRRPNTIPRALWEKIECDNIVGHWKHFPAADAANAALSTAICAYLRTLADAKREVGT